MYTSDCCCYGKVPDEKYQLLILVNYCLNLQSAKALLKTTKVKKMVMLYSLVLPSADIQSCGLIAVYFYVNVFSTFPTSLSSAQLWQKDGDRAHPESFRAKENLNKTYNPPKRLSMFDLLSHIPPQQSLRIVFSLLLTVLLNKIYISIWNVKVLFLPNYGNSKHEVATC